MPEIFKKTELWNPRRNCFGFSASPVCQCGVFFGRDHDKQHRLFYTLFQRLRWSFSVVSNSTDNDKQSSTLLVMCWSLHWGSRELLHRTDPSTSASVRHFNASSTRIRGYVCSRLQKATTIHATSLQSQVTQKITLTTLTTKPLSSKKSQAHAQTDGKPKHKQTNENNKQNAIQLL